MADLIVVGAGLAGSEAAWQAAERGVNVLLYEMRPYVKTGAHQTPFFAELVCSNSLGSFLPDRASGVLRNELHRLGSLLIRCAEETAVPAGGSLAVDRDSFARLVTERIEGHKMIKIIREEVKSIPDQPVLIASGPLTSSTLASALTDLTGHEYLYFYDAIAPIVTSESINMDIAFKASRYGRGQQKEGDYINCPMTKNEYEMFIDALLSAEKIELHDFENSISNGVQAGPRRYFEGCLPIEALAQRGRYSLAYGPLRPVGLTDPRNRKKAYAVVQLRQDNLSGSLYNIVGFQTNLLFPEQLRIIQMIPGLEQAEIVRFGQMHRNTFLFSPALLYPTMQFRERSDLFFAGQITGVEGYLGNIATGLLAGWNTAQVLHGESPVVMPCTTIIGALCHYITQASPVDFQPMKANFGILPPIECDRHTGRRQRAMLYSNRARIDMDAFITEMAANKGW
jgi:methylenetetrahydrofolate--tRNA-(uracil-5-)-methyltransferase